MLLLLWNNTSVDKLRKLISQGTNVLPDDRYFELKHKIQYLTFAFSLIVIIIGLLGLNTITKIQADVLKNLNVLHSNFYHLFLFRLFFGNIYL